MGAPPTVINYPTTLDDETSLFGKPSNAVVLTLASQMSDVATTFVVTNDISGIDVPTFFSFSNGEVVYAEAKDNGTKTFSSVGRAVSGTAAIHDADTYAKQIMVANYLGQYRDAIIALETKTGIDNSAVVTTIDYILSNHTHQGTDGSSVFGAGDIPGTAIDGTGLDADTLDTYHASNFGTAADVKLSFTEELSINGSIAPFTGTPAGLELSESSGAGDFKVLIPRLKFSESTPGTDTGRMWTFKLKATPTTMQLKVLFYMSAGTTNNVLWKCQIAAVTPDTAEVISTKAFSTVNSQATAVPGTLGALATSTISLTNADSWAKDDWVCLLLWRDANDASDTATGDAYVVSVCLVYT